MTATITNLSETGAALEFVPSLGKQNVIFEIGNSVSISSTETSEITGNVVRHYEGGLAMQFAIENDEVLGHIFEIINGELLEEEI